MAPEIMLDVEEVFVDPNTQSVGVDRITGSPSGYALYLLRP